MKTTIDIPETLYKKAATRALESGQTFDQVVVSSLEAELNLSTVGSTTEEPPQSYWANRKLLPNFQKYWESTELVGGTDSTIIISEGRDER